MRSPLFVIGDQKHRILSMDFFGGELSNLMLMTNGETLFVRLKKELKQNEIEFAENNRILVGDIESRIEWPEGEPRHGH